jgi:anthranilate phosphoribosyltransferase
MDMQSAIKRVIAREDLSGNEMRHVMQLIMTGEATPAQVGGFLVGLRCKGESVVEITAAAEVMRELAAHVNVGPEHLIDTCGTGGDSSGTFNVSTASALVVAAAGGRVAKHGNRSVSSSSGSADVLEKAGVRLDLTPDQVAECINEVGVGFMFAPLHHSAMKHAIGPRREMGVRTIFNVLGPLTNPADAPNQVMGVFDVQLLEPLAEVLSRLGSQHVMVVHGDDGMDEISISSPTHVAELRDSAISTYMLSPEQFGMHRRPIDTIKVDDIDGSLRMMQDVLANVDGPARDIVALNAGAAIYTCGLEKEIDAGVQRALDVLASGAAAEKLEQLVAVTNNF